MKNTTDTRDNYQQAIKLLAAIVYQWWVSGVHTSVYPAPAHLSQSGSNQE